MNHDRDILWKSILKSTFDDLLRFIFPKADQLFDMKKGFTFLDKELAGMFPEPGKAADTRFADQLVQVYRRDGKEEWILIHIEVQADTKAKDRPLFPERMFRYFYRIYDKHRKPVAAIAIFTGNDGRQLTDTFEYELLNTRLQYRYNTICILDYPDEELAKSNNPFALVLLVAKQALLKGKDLDSKLLEGKMFIFRKLNEKGLMRRHKIQMIFHFLNNYVQFEKLEIYRTFKEQIDKETGKENTMDILEAVAQIRERKGLEKGREEAIRMVVENLIKRPGFDEKEIASIANVTVSFVKKVKADLRKK